MNCHTVFNCDGHNHKLSDNRLIKETVLRYVNEAEFKELFTIAALDKIETVTSSAIAATSSAVKASLDARNAVNDLTIQTMDFVNDAINNTAVEGGILADTFVTVDNKINQRQINMGLESIDQLLNISNPRNGFLVSTKSYIAGKNKGGNTYRYNSARAAENDGGSVINGWEVVGKTALTVWDFGYEIGNQQGSKAALTKALISVMPLELLAETLNAHVGVGGGNDVLAQTIDTNKHIFGTGPDSSVIEGLRLHSIGDTFLARDFSINKNGLNYAIFIGGYKDVTVENFRSRGNLDAVLIMHAKDDNSKALVSNCYSENSSRVGFTSDVGAKNVIFQNCISYNCRQGFHAEIQEDTTFIDCIADACGDGAMPAIPEIQPPEYAGGFRLHEFDGVSLIRCKNINKNGTNIDQMGSRGKDLSMDGCEGINFYVEDYSVAVYENISILNTKNCGLSVGGRGASITGKLIIRNFDGGSLDMIGANITAVNSVEYMELVNVRSDRIQIWTLHPKAVLYADNVHITSDFFNEWKGFIHFILGDLTLTRPNLNNDLYPNFGFIFNSINCETFSLNKFTLAGPSAAYALHFREMPTGLRCTILSCDGVGNHFNIANPAGVEINNLTYTVTGNTPGVVTTTLSNATSDINKYGKFRGKEIWDDTSNKFMKATGSNASSTWISLDGLVTVTPV